MDDTVPTAHQQAPGGMPQPQADPVSGATASDDLLAHAIAQVEAVVAKTPTDPVERTTQLHAIKRAYLQAAHNVTTTDKQP